MQLLTLLYMTIFGIMTISITPNEQVRNLAVIHSHRCLHIDMLSIIMSITTDFPGTQVAATLLGAIYFLMELFCGFIIPGPEIPVYAKWIYWANPVSWTVYGVVASQLGTVHDEFVIQASRGSFSTSRGVAIAAQWLPTLKQGCALQADGTRVSVSEFLGIFYGFCYSYMGVVTVTLIAFCVGMWLASVAALRCAILLRPPNQSLHGVAPMHRHLHELTCHHRSCYAYGC